MSKLAALCGSCCDAEDRLAGRRDSSYDSSIIRKLKSMGLQGPEQPPVSHRKPKQLIVLCHGMGANGTAALHNIAPHLSNALPDAEFVAPHAPELLHGNAAQKRRWFNMDDFNPERLGPAIRNAAAALDEFVDLELTKFEVPVTDYALVGFSQGAMTVLYTGLRRKVPPRAIISFSGALIDPASLAAEIKNHAPVFLGHGQMDHILSPHYSDEAAVALKAAGVPVDTYYSPSLEHGIDEACFGAARSFLQKAFSGNK